MNKSASQLQLYLWLLTLGPASVALITELNKRTLIRHMRIVDFADLVLVAPMLILLFLAITQLVIARKSTPAYWATLLLSILMIYGHSMHVTANAINTYSTEIQNYRSIIPEDTYGLIYFFDEMLGHWLLYIGLFGTMGMWVSESQITHEQVNGMRIGGFLIGLFLSISIIESSQPIIVPLAAGWLVCVIAYKVLRVSRAVRADRFKIDLFANYAALLVVGLIVGALGYLLFTGGLTQPSDLFWNL